MKRFGYIFHQVCSFSNLVASVIEAARGKKNNPRVARFIQDLENEVIDLEKELLEKSYTPRPYRTFMVHDPKTRRICAADFRDRVVHHALCRVIEPILERSFIFDTFACRKEKGTHRAIERAHSFCRRFRYFLKSDVHKFFDSIDHRILKDRLRRRIKDPDVLWLLDLFIDHPVPWTEDGCGIPIGNLTSQHFANFYLSGLDHFIKERLIIEGYIRYMDDLLLFANEKETLWDASTRIERYLRENLSLRIKDSSLLLAPVFQGIPFLGFRIFPAVIRISRQGWRRFRRKVQQGSNCLINADGDEEQWMRSMASLLGHIKHANTRNLRASFFHRPEAEGALTG